jgi:serine/threonine-protein kinase
VHPRREDTRRGRRDILRGTQVDGYQIVRRLGRGGMGEVYEAVRAGPGGFRRPVALKQLIGDAAIHGDSVQRFLTEARILSGLDHVNVIEVYDVIAAERGYVMVMELLAGATLGALVKAADGTLPVDELCEIADQALAGLIHVHAACGPDGKPLGLVHRDLTPSNVFITDDGVVKLLDFGIAKLRDAIDAPVTRDNEVRGTLEMISPEQAAGEPADPRTDLYQLAASLYRALTGRYPHGTGTTLELIARAASVQPPSVAELRPDVPAALAAVVDRAMAMDPAARFADAEAMRAALAAASPPRDSAKQRLAARAGAARPAPIVDGTTTAPEPSPAGPESNQPPTVADQPRARSAEQRREPPSAEPRPAPAGKRRWWIGGATAAIAVAGGALGWSQLRDRASAPPRAADAHVRSTAVVPTSIDITVARGERTAVSAAPTADGGFVFATGREVVVVPRSGELAPITLPDKLWPLDVEPLTDDGVAFTAQDAGGNYKTMVARHGVSNLLNRSSNDSVFATSRDGMKQAVSTHGSDVEQVPMQNDQLSWKLRVSSFEIVLALAWSPDGSQLAVMRENRRLDTGDILLVRNDTDKATTVKTRRFYGDAPVLGWLDAGHLAYAINEPTQAVVYRLDVATGVEEPLRQYAGERIVGGHAAFGAVAYLHGTPSHSLLVGSIHGPLADAGPAIAVAGFDRGGRVVIGTAEGVVARAADGTRMPWPGTRAGDVPRSIVGDAVIVARAGTLWRLAPDGAHAIGELRDTLVRCAGDAIEPCVARDVRDRSSPHHAIVDTITGELGKHVTEYTPRSVEHAVSADGTRFVRVDGGGYADVADVRSKKDLSDVAIFGARLDHVAWAGDELVVSARWWNGHPWALLAAPLDKTKPRRVLAESRIDRSAEVRVGGDQVAVVTTDVVPTLTVLSYPP